MTTAVSEGATDESLISKVMGHTSITMTMRYTRPPNDALRDVTRALDVGTIMERDRVE